MDTLHTVMRTLRGETKSTRPDHLTVFREFLDQLDRIGRARARRPRTVKRAKAKSTRSGKR
jgi:hypothetical protein